jgi:hypothetical protein
VFLPTLQLAWPHTGMKVPACSTAWPPVPTWPPGTTWPPVPTWPRSGMISHDIKAAGGSRQIGHMIVCGRRSSGCHEYLGVTSRERRYCSFLRGVHSCPLLPTPAHSCPLLPSRCSREYTSVPNLHCRNFLRKVIDYLLEKSDFEIFLIFMGVFHQKFSLGFIQYYILDTLNLL